MRFARCWTGHLREAPKFLLLRGPSWPSAFSVLNPCLLAGPRTIRTRGQVASWTPPRPIHRSMTGGEMCESGRDKSPTMTGGP